MGFKKGDIVVYICKGETFLLTNDQKYEIVEIADRVDCVYVINDKGMKCSYLDTRFISLEVYRSDIIYNILK